MLAELPRRVESVGAHVVYDVHFDGEGHPLLLVHGGRAHRGWWDHLAPLISVPWAALDLSGHGASGWRPEYSYRLWAEDIMAVAHDCAQLLGRPVVVVAHSLGGIASLQQEVREHEDVRAVISLDGAPMPGFQSIPSTSPSAGYATLEEAVEHFARARNRESWAPGLVDSVARRSVREVDGRYRWTHDLRTVGTRHPETCGADATPVSILRGENSQFFDAIAASSALDIPGLRLTTVPGVSHDMMMERPELVVQAVLGELRALLP